MQNSDGKVSTFANLPQSSKQMNPMKRRGLLIRRLWEKIKVTEGRSTYVL